MDWSDGSFYEGEWQKGLKHGQGRLVLPDGRVKEGLFRNNKYCGGRAPTSPDQNTIQKQVIREEDGEDEQ